MSDAVLLEGILRNLIRNSLKYNGPGGRVLVGCRRRGALLRIEVHDTGIGIASDKLLKDACHRPDSTRADELGLGLFVVRRTADLLGHRIEVRSTVGRGSCFSLLAEVAAAISEGEARGFVRGRKTVPANDLLPDEMPTYRPSEEHRSPRRRNCDAYNRNYLALIALSLFSLSYL